MAAARTINAVHHPEHGVRGHHRAPYAPCSERHRTSAGDELGGPLNRCMRLGGGSTQKRPDMPITSGASVIVMPSLAQSDME